MPRTPASASATTLKALLPHQLESGRFGSAREVVRSGLRLLEDTETRTAALRQALVDGEQSGIAPYSYDAFIAELDELGK